MATKEELQKRIAELEAEQARTEILYRIGHDLNTAGDEDELLQILIRSTIGVEVFQADLMYIDSNEIGEPWWIEIVATWRREGESPMPVGTRLYLPEFPFARLWLASQNEPLLVSDITIDERVDENTRNAMAQAGNRALAVIPLVQSGRWVGFLTFNWHEPHQFSQQEKEIYRAFIDLAAPAVENRRLADEIYLLREAIEFAGIGISTFNFEGVVLNMNRSYVRILDVEAQFPDPAAVTGKNVADLHHYTGAKASLRKQLRQHNYLHKAEYSFKTLNGVVKWLLHDSRLICNPKTGEETIQMIARDITKRKQTEEKQERLQQEIFEAQQRAIQELSTPVIPIMSASGGAGSIIVMPLVGSIDSMRAKDIMRTLLAGIREHRAKVVILDITGVPIVDSGVANHLNKTIKAARLKGARAIVTGISEAVAETIVDLGIDWSKIETLSDLQTGLIVALNSLGLKLSKT